MILSEKPALGLDPRMSFFGIMLYASRQIGIGSS
jgi:hypothetical protein